MVNVTMNRGDKLILNNDLTQNSYLTLDASNNILIDNLGAECLRIDSNGNFGIKTATLRSKFNIESDITNTDETNAVMQLELRGKTNESVQLLIGYNTQGDYGFIQANNYGVGSKPLIIQKYGGDIGIGTSSPGARVDIQSGANAYGLKLGFGSSGVSDWVFANSFYSGMGQSTYALNIGTGDSTNGQDLFLLTKNTSHVNGMVIKASGNVGIGTASPAASLHVVHGGSVGDIVLALDRTIADDTTIFFYNNGVAKWAVGHAYSANVFYIYPQGTGQGLAVTETGQVGIGTNTPASTTNFAVIGLNPSIGTTIVVDGSGNFYKSSSSRRHKDNIQPLKEDFKKILEAAPKSFTYKITGLSDVGFIAEEFEDLGLKNLVIYDQEGRPDALKYDRIPLYILEIIKLQESRIKALENKVR